jgi:hypothetical protein
MEVISPRSLLQHGQVQYRFNPEQCSVCSATKAKTRTFVVLAKITEDSSIRDLRASQATSSSYIVVVGASTSYFFPEDIFWFAVSRIGSISLSIRIGFLRKLRHTFRPCLDLDEGSVVR